MNIMMAFYFLREYSSHRILWQKSKKWLVRESCQKNEIGPFQKSRRHQHLGWGRSNIRFLVLCKQFFFFAFYL